MAVTKIKPIKSTLSKALDYIENPDKTDDKMLVSSFGCSYETADIEFQMLLDQAFKKGNNLAHHLIQAFEPGETTPEQAHEIGRQLADEVLQGKYPYVLTTHIDKGHLHNHIIFCAVDMVQQRKYISNRRSYAYIRRTSDRLCKENGLSVVKPGKDKGKSYAEWDAQRKGKSWKAKLKIAIDAAIPQAKDFDDFLRLMAAQVLRAVCAPYRWLETNVELTCGGVTYSVKGKAVLDPGWRVYDSAERRDSSLPELHEGDELPVLSAEVKEGQTSPPAHFTEGTLLTAMENAGDTPDESERKGLGTPATRAGIIEKLVAAGFIERKKAKKNTALIPTQTGAALSAVLALLFTVYMLNLDMKLMRSVVLPFLNKHYDSQKRDRRIV